MKSIIKKIVSTQYFMTDFRPSRFWSQKQQNASTLKDLCRKTSQVFTPIHEWIQKIVISLILGGLFTATLLLAENTTDERLRMQADQVEIMTVAGQQIQRFEGNVRLVQGKARLACEKAVWYKAEGKVILEKNVVLDDGEKILTADFVTHYEHLKKEEARGNVKIIDSLRTLTAERVVYWEEEDKAIADRNVKIVESQQNLVLTGGHAEYYRANDSVLVTFDPVLIQYDSLDQEEIRVTGEVMELARNGEVAIVTDSVKITQDSTEARCGVAEFWRELNKIILRIDPKVWQTGQQLKGDSIELYFNKNELELVKVLNDAEILAKVDSIDQITRWNKLNGQLMTIHIKKNQMEKIIIENQATSWYHIIENKKYKGLNKVTGDKIRLFLTGGKLHRIQIESNPGLSSGIFYPAGKAIPESELITAK